VGRAWRALGRPRYAGYAAGLAGPSKLQQPPGLAYQSHQSQAASTSSLPREPQVRRGTGAERTSRCPGSAFPCENRGLSPSRVTPRSPGSAPLGQRPDGQVGPVLDCHFGVPLLVPTSAAVIAIQDGCHWLPQSRPAAAKRTALASEVPPTDCRRSFMRPGNPRPLAGIRPRVYAYAILIRPIQPSQFPAAAVLQASTKL